MTNDHTYSSMNNPSSAKYVPRNSKATRALDFLVAGYEGNLSENAAFAIEQTQKILTDELYRKSATSSYHASWDKKLKDIAEVVEYATSNLDSADAAATLDKIQQMTATAIANNTYLQKKFYGNTGFEKKATVYQNKFTQTFTNAKKTLDSKLADVASTYSVPVASAYAPIGADRASNEITTVLTDMSKVPATSLEAVVTQAPASSVPSQPRAYRQESKTSTYNNGFTDLWGAWDQFGSIIDKGIAYVRRELKQADLAIQSYRDSQKFKMPSRDEAMYAQPSAPIFSDDAKLVARYALNEIKGMKAIPKNVWNLGKEAAFSPIKVARDVKNLYDRRAKKGVYQPYYGLAPHEDPLDAAFSWIRGPAVAATLLFVGYVSLTSPIQNAPPQAVKLTQAPTSSSVASNTRTNNPSIGPSFAFLK